MKGHWTGAQRWTMCWTYIRVLLLVKTVVTIGAQWIPMAHVMLKIKQKVEQDLK